MAARKDYPRSRARAASPGDSSTTAGLTEAAGATSAGVAPTVAAAFEAELAEAYRQADEARQEVEVARQEAEAARQEAEEATEQASANWDRYLRAEADLDNQRKRGERLLQEAVSRQRRELLGRFLEVADNLERALAHAEADPSALRAGIEGTYRLMVQMLEREGALRIEAMDAPFDPHLHEAVGVVTMPGLSEERIISVEQPGYTLDGDLLRAARVIVGQPADA